MGSGGNTKRDRGVIRVPHPKRIVTSDSANLRVSVNKSDNDSRVRIEGPQCKRFGLVRPTAAAISAKAGMHIWGDFNDPRVSIISKVGELGDAPSQVAQFFIRERERGNVQTLKGTILKSTTREVRVLLCLHSPNKLVLTPSQSNWYFHEFCECRLASVVRI
jgi:hypothetical protein